MYELIQVVNNSYYVNCPAKIGVYRCADNGVYLIDSGNDKDAGRKVRRVLEAEEWHIKAILNTHSHADHTGGNRYFQQNTGCKIFAPGIEACIANHPILEPALLYGGAPVKQLRHKFLMAQESVCFNISSPDFPSDIEVIPLNGHCFDMVGYRTPDDVVFLADCVSSSATLEKYKIAYLYDVQAYLNTLDFVDTLSAKVFVPSHAEPVEDIHVLTKLNRDAVHEVAEKLLSVCATPTDFETILQYIFNDYGLTLNFEQYALIGSTLRSYLSWLLDGGRLSVSFEDNMLLWKTV